MDGLQRTKRQQTALRLDLNSVVGLGLVLANLRFDSPVLVAAATVSVVLLVIRTIVGYLNARVSMLGRRWEGA